MQTATIVIPTYNRAALLPRAIEAALAQDYPCEVIVCDHGSSDDTPGVAARYGSRIRYIRREQDQGPIACWRDGVEHANGDVVQLTYDDDWLEPTFLSTCIPLLQPQVGFVYTQAAIHDSASDTVTTSPHPAGIRPMALITRYLLRSPRTISPGCALFRRSDVLRNLLPEVPGAAGRYGKKSGVGEDLLLFLLTSLNYSHYAHVPAPLAHFLAHPQSITTNAVLSSRLEALNAAYANAKTHYYKQPGAEHRRNRVLQILDRLYWELAAGQALARAARRLAQRRSLTTG